MRFNKILLTLLVAGWVDYAQASAAAAIGVLLSASATTAAGQHSRHRAQEQEEELLGLAPRRALSEGEVNQLKESVQRKNWAVCGRAQPDMTRLYTPPKGGVLTTADVDKASFAWDVCRTVAANRAARQAALVGK